MSDATERFFEELARRGHEPALARVTGRVRFEIVDGRDTRHWLLDIADGDITVSRKKGKADCTIRGEVELFDRLARGEDNAMAATLRGALTCAGEVDLLLAVQKLFPGPSSGTAERSAG
jgi:predicted lipid carrier protein YhbT